MRTSSVDLLDTFLAQARAFLGKAPAELLLTPPALSALTAKGIAVPERRGETLIRCVTPDEIVPGEGDKVALVVMDHDVFRALRLVRAA